VNSLLEEYVWRWFVVRQFTRLLTARKAIAASAIVFAVNHAVGLATIMPPEAVLVCLVGVVVGGLIWSWLYERTRSIWPGYISHAIAVAAIMAVGYRVVFG
jgi:membrane protease YdiL (CAAX protease family)